MVDGELVVHGVFAGKKPFTKPLTNTVRMAPVAARA